MARVFISYSSSDRGTVEQIATDLKANRVEVWFDQWEMLPGDSLIQKIGGAILENEFFVVVISPNSVNSEWVTRELSVALTDEFKKRKIKVIPALIRECSIPAFLMDKMYADFRQDYRQGLAQLLKALRRSNVRKAISTSVPKNDSHRIVWDNVVSGNIVETNIMDDVGDRGTR